MVADNLAFHPLTLQSFPDTLNPSAYMISQDRLPDKGTDSATKVADYQKKNTSPTISQGINADTGYLSLVPDPSQDTNTAQDPHLSQETHHPITS